MEKGTITVKEKEIINRIIYEMTPEQFQERQQKLREALFKSDIDTYYAVHSDGHHEGWKSLTQLLNDKINHYMDAVRERMDEDDNKDEIHLAKLRGRIDGLRDALQLIKESNQ
jgi:hypothetical protein